MPTTSNFGWTTPADTDLVKDGAAAIRTLGNGIDTSLVDLKGGTTGQVLSKNSNTDLDFAWVAQDDSNAIQNALLTTTGDTIYASAASTPARLGLGTAGQVLTVNSGATAPEWKTPAGGGLTLISETVASALSSLSLSSIPATYSELYLVWHGLFPSNTNTSFGLRFNNDSGANMYKGIYQLTSTFNFDANNATANNNDRTIISFTNTNTTNLTDNSRGWLRFPNYASTSKIKQYSGVFANYAPNTSWFLANIDGTYMSTSAISSIDFYRASGAGTFSNATNTSIRLYGVA